MIQGLNNVLKELPPIRLDEMKSVALLNRVDTKFIFHIDELERILKKASAHYSVLEIEERRVSTYRNLYFDTEHLNFYKDHHNGKMNRVKVRMRKYLDSDLCYLECKRKSNKGRTHKIRQRINDFEEVLKGDDALFLKDITNEYGQLEPVLWNEFNRITLVNLEDKERVTFDLGLSFNAKGSTATYDKLVIAEIKQAGFNRNTTFFNLLKSLKINPFRVSKYCIGLISIDPGVKHNTFKEKIRRINKITSS